MSSARDATAAREPAWRAFNVASALALVLGVVCVPRALLVVAAARAGAWPGVMSVYSRDPLGAFAMAGALAALVYFMSFVFVHIAWEAPPRREPAREVDTDVLIVGARRVLRQALARVSQFTDSSATGTAARAQAATCAARRSRSRSRGRGGA